MRIRSTKPEFWRSRTIANLDYFTRLVLKALESYVDDNGVGKDSVTIFCADAFPHDLARSPEICAKVSGSLSRLSEAGLIARYSISQEELVYVRRWKKWQYIDKPKQGRYPRPDGTMNYRDEVDETIGAGQGVTDSVADADPSAVPENFAKTARNLPEECPQIQSGEQGNRGSEDQLEDDAPAFVETAARPAKRHASSSHKTLVRQELGNEYPRTTIDRLAIQVENLLREGQPDTLIREALHEWDRRENCAKPEFLPTVLADLVKASRAVPGNNGKPAHKMRALATLAQQVQAEEQAEQAVNRRELA